MADDLYTANLEAQVETYKHIDKIREIRFLDPFDSKASSVFESTTSFFWTSLGNWTWALVEAHLLPDYVFDADFTSERLARYDILLLPLSPALAEQQARLALDFARGGGVLVLGIGAGQRRRVIRSIAT